MPWAEVFYLEGVAGVVAAARGPEAEQEPQEAAPLPEAVAAAGAVAAEWWALLGPARGVVDVIQILQHLDHHAS